MAPAGDFPCNGDGVCMVCKTAPPEAEVVHCRTCATPWLVPCLAQPPETLVAVADWECPDCSPMGAASTPAPAPVALSGGSGDLIASIWAIEADTSLTNQEKARRQQALVGGGASPADDEEKGKKRKGESEDDVLDLFDEKFKCAFCMQLPERPVTQIRSLAFLTIGLALGMVLMATVISLASHSCINLTTMLIVWIIIAIPSVIYVVYTLASHQNQWNKERRLGPA